MKTYSSAQLIAAIIFVAAFGLVGCTNTTTAAATAPLSSNASSQTPRIAVVSAFAPELDALLSAVQIESTEVINGTTFRLGKIRGKEVVVFLSGISTVNATMTMQLAIDHFKLTHVVLSGIAGGVNPSLHVGDVAVPQQWANYQDQTFAREVAPNRFEPEPWQTKELGSYGMMFPQYMRVVLPGGLPDKTSPVFWFDVDARMLTTAQAVATSVELEKCAPNGACLPALPTVKVGGRGVSGPTFVDNADYRTWVWTNFQDSHGRGVDALDMESASVAVVAHVNRIPFIAFRALSDLAGGGRASSNEIQTFFSLASRNSAKLVERFVEAL